MPNISKSAASAPHKRPFALGSIILFLLLILVCGFIMLRSSYVYHRDLFRHRESKLVEEAETEIQNFLDVQDLEESRITGEPQFTSFKMLGLQEIPCPESGKVYEAYIWMVSSGFSSAHPVTKDTEPVSGSSLPALLTIEQCQDGSLQVVSIDIPRDGSNYPEDMKMFPWSIREAMKHEESEHLVNTLQELNQTKAWAALSAV